jgi:hypothetical protein
MTYPHHCNLPFSFRQEPSRYWGGRQTKEQKYSPPNCKRAEDLKYDLQEVSVVVLQSGTA